MEVVGFPMPGSIILGEGVASLFSAEERASLTRRKGRTCFFMQVNPCLLQSNFRGLFGWWELFSACFVSLKRKILLLHIDVLVFEHLYSRVEEETRRRKRKQSCDFAIVDLF